MPSGQCGRVVVVERICNAFICTMRCEPINISINTCINIVLFDSTLFCSRTHTKITKGTQNTHKYPKYIHNAHTTHTLYYSHIIIENTPPHSIKIMALFYA